MMKKDNSKILVEDEENLSMLLDYNLSKFAQIIKEEIKL